MSKKYQDLQPWLDYFKLLHNYERNGYLEVMADKHEAFVTQAAIHAMTPGDNPAEQVRSGAIADTVRRLRTYVASLSACQRGSMDYDSKNVTDPEAPLPKIPMEEMAEYITQPFALHVVKDDPTHDLLYTVLLTTEQNRLGRGKEHIEIISYKDL